MEHGRNTRSRDVAKRTAFLADDHVAIMAIERQDKPPLTVRIWYRIDETGGIEIWTELGSLKERCGHNDHISVAGELGAPGLG